MQFLKPPEITSFFLLFFCLFFLFLHLKAYFYGVLGFFFFFSLTIETVVLQPCHNQRRVNYLFMNIVQNHWGSHYFHIDCKLKIPNIVKADLIMIFALNTTYFSAVSKTYSPASTINQMKQSFNLTFIFKSGYKTCSYAMRERLWECEKKNTVLCLFKIFVVICVFAVFPLSDNWDRHQLDKWSKNGGIDGAS